MTILLLQLAGLLLAAAVIGLFVGWQLASRRAEARLTDVSAEANRRYREVHERANEAATNLEAATQKLASIGADQKQASRRLRNLTGALSDSESTVAGLEADVELLQSTIEELRATHAEELLAAQQAAEALLEADADTERAGDQVAALEATLAERDSALEALEKLVDARDAALMQLREQMAGAKQAEQEWHNAAQRAEADKARLASDLGEARDSAAKHEAAARLAAENCEAAAAAAAQEIDRLQADLARLRPGAAVAHAETATLRRRLESAGIIEQELRADLSAAQSLLLELEEQRRLLAARANRDDLKRIKGIGPVLERALKEQGITKFSQIAALSPEDIEAISAALQTFPDRIHRDRWVEQAQQLQRGE